MNELGLSTMDSLDDGILDEMQTALETNFPLLVVRAAPVMMAGNEWDEKRNQHSAPLVLRRVLTTRAPWTRKLLAVTTCDLFIPMLSFVYGQAQLGGRAAVVSLARLRQQFYGLPENVTLLLARSRKEAVHETGHLFGLVHCPDTACAMSLSTNVRQIDLKTDALCPACRAQVWEGSL
jgi:archaemetzincin